MSLHSHGVSPFFAVAVTTAVTATVTCSQKTHAGVCPVAVVTSASEGEQEADWAEEALGEHFLQALELHGGEQWGGNSLRCTHLSRCLNQIFRG